MHSLNIFTSLLFIKPMDKYIQHQKGSVFGYKKTAKKYSHKNDENKDFLIQTLKQEAGENVLDFISSHFSFDRHETILYTSRQEKLYNNVDFDNLRVIINLQLVNRHGKINSLFRAINSFLPNAGLYIGCVETYEVRKQSMKKKFGKVIANTLWGFDFVFNRVIPRLKVTKSLYYVITKNKYRCLSLAETLGRLVYCGFDIIEYKEIDGKVYFVVMKTSEPKADKQVSNGILFPMKRVGKNGKIIKVYKVRTMHPYSEFLQEFVLKLNGYNNLGKPANDFRIAGWGKILRKLWLDEIPQLYNVLKGDLGIVGVRPLSQVRYNQFPEDMKRERIKYRPGCIPPYVSLCMPDATGNIEAERIYLNEMKNNPFITNIKYFALAVFNIATNRIHSA
jgi:hypothetical protein